MPRDAKQEATRTVLLADDPTILQALRGTFVTRADWRVLAAASAALALAKGRAERPDLTILDADTWGREAARDLRADPDTASISIVLVCAGSRGAIANADAVLRRPFERAEVERVLPELLGARTRASVRKHAAIRATCLHAGTSARTFTKDIGLGGLFLRTRGALAPGLAVQLIVELPGDPLATVRAAAEVVRVVPAERDSHLVPGAALRFVELGLRDRRKLTRFIEAGATDG